MTTFLFKKIIASIISALAGLVLIPVLAINFQDEFFKSIPILIIYFLPGYSISLLILFEVITNIKALQPVHKFIQGPKISILFIGLLAVEWIIIWQVEPFNDVVFASQFVTATIPAMKLFSWLGEKWNML